MKNFIASLFVILFPIISFSQEIQENTNTIEETEKVEKVRKNTIRVNITNPILIEASNFILGYERIVGDHQSFSIDLGINQLPGFKERTFQLDETTTLANRNEGNEIGIHATADYRFYLAKENKYKAPRGIYIGPYISHNSFRKSNEWELSSEDFNGLVNTDIRFNINTIGIEMGYQFVISDRIALDFIMIGPGLSNYNFKINSDSNLSEEDQELLYGKINDFLAEKIPGYDIVIDGEGIEKRGSVNTTSFGYRFMINVGYRF
jgi:hypothetical protein